jgi:signal transduction histidine kinase
VANPSAEPNELGRMVARDLAAASRRLIFARWAAGATVLLATFASRRWLGVPIPSPSVYLIGLAILLFNAALSIVYRFIPGAEPSVYVLYNAAQSTVYRLVPASEPSVRLARLRQLVVLQVGLDWLCMAAFLHFTGGVTSPAIVFLLIHMLMVTILLPGVSSYLYVALGVGGLLILGLLEAGGVLAHHSVLPALPPDLYRDPLYIASEVIFFAIAAIATVTLATGIIAQLQRRERQISALFQTTSAVSSSLSLSEVLNQLTRNAAQAVGTTHSSIRLLDETGETLRLASAYGLSPAFQQKEIVAVSNNPLVQEALLGRPSIVQETAEDPRLQQDARRLLDEGIHSLVVAPISGRSGPLGILRVYADQPRRFNGADAQFVMAIARQGAVAIENAMAHETLQRADTERAQFVRTVTHELRSPVAGAQSLLRVLLQQMAGELSPSHQDIIRRVETRLEALMALINDLLTLAASTTKGFQEKPELIALVPEIHSALELRSAEALEKSITLAFTPPSGDAWVIAGHEGLGHIFGNLIGNAVKYTPKGGRVTVSLEIRDAIASVSVADTGMGIPEDELPKLWQEFFRASNAKQSGIPGTGLGLSIVKRRVEAYGGMISVQSAVNQGTTVTVTLPLVPGPSA